MISWSIARVLGVNGNGIFIYKQCLTQISSSNEGSVFITVVWKYLLYAPHYGTMSASSFIYYYYFRKFDPHQVSHTLWPCARVSLVNTDTHSLILVILYTHHSIF